MISKDMNYNKVVGQKIGNAFWDYNVDSAELFDILLNKKAGNGFFNKEYILRRLLDRLSWYELIDVLGIDYIRQNLSKSIISKLRNNTLKERYEFVRKFLQEETLPFSGWDNKTCERLKSSVLSDRWNCP